MARKQGRTNRLPPEWLLVPDTANREAPERYRRGFLGSARAISQVWDHVVNAADAERAIAAANAALEAFRRTPGDEGGEHFLAAVERQGEADAFSTSANVMIAAGRRKACPCCVRAAVHRWHLEVQRWAEESVRTGQGLMNPPVMRVAKVPATDGLFVIEVSTMDKPAEASQPKR